MLIIQTELKMSKLLDELKKVKDWYTLGIHLDLNPSDLKKVKEDNTSDDDALSDMMQRWLKLKSEVSSSRRDIVSALKKMNEDCVADNIEELFTHTGDYN